VLQHLLKDDKLMLQNVAKSFYKKIKGGEKMERLTLKEAALYIGASDFKLREMVRQKQIPHYKIGNRVLFRKSKLDEWISMQEEAGSRNIPVV
jgi:excisionase family DNA binding protein